MKAAGSSPLTRGARCAFSHGFGSGGIIPAHAGSTLLLRESRREFGDHPRSRGEHFECFQASPWGHGIIPAHAGSTGRCYAPPPFPRDHPRSRGEHGTVTEASAAAGGSSPLTRGARVVAGESG